MRARSAPNSALGALAERLILDSCSVLELGAPLHLVFDYLRAFSIYEGELGEMSISSIEIQLLCRRHSNSLQIESIH